MSHKLGRRRLKQQIEALSKNAARDDAAHAAMYSKLLASERLAAKLSREKQELEDRLTGLPDCFKMYIDKRREYFGEVYQISIQWPVMEIVRSIGRSSRYGDPIGLAEESGRVGRELGHRIGREIFKQLTPDFNHRKESSP